MTKKETAKTEITQILKTNKEGFTVTEIHNQVSQVIEISKDTIRMAIKDLAKGKKIKPEIREKTTFWKTFTKSRKTIKPLPIDKKDRGWKMRLITQWFSQLGQGESIPRRKLAIACKTDERNLHIMVSKIKEKGDYLFIEYDRKNRTYTATI